MAFVSIYAMIKYVLFLQLGLLTGNGVSDLVTVECGGDFTLAVEASGKVWGWGSNQVGQVTTLIYKFY